MGTSIHAWADYGCAVLAYRPDRFNDCVLHAWALQVHITCKHVPPSKRRYTASLSHLLTSRIDSVWPHVGLLTLRNGTNALNRCLEML